MGVGLKKRGRHRHIYNLGRTILSEQNKIDARLWNRIANVCYCRCGKIKPARKSADGK